MACFTQGGWMKTLIGLALCFSLGCGAAYAGPFDNDNGTPVSPWQNSAGMKYDGQNSGSSYGMSNGTSNGSSWSRQDKDDDDDAKRSTSWPVLGNPGGKPSRDGASGSLLR